MTSTSTRRQRPAGEEQGGADSEKVAELAERLELLELEAEGLLQRMADKVPGSVVLWQLYTLSCRRR
jgi:hypothetical protein